MSHNHKHDEECKCSPAAHRCMKIAKLVLKAAQVAATICIAKEIHRVHKAIEAKKR